MKPITVRLSPQTVDELDNEADERELSRAEYVRELIRTRDESEEIQDEYEAELDRLRSELDKMRTENDRLRREKRQVLDVREENNELVRFAEAERDRRNQEQEIKSAPAWRRAKYWLLGRPAEDTPDE